MNKIILSTLGILILNSCQENKKNTGYEITGTLKNIPDSSIVYISENNINIDSTIVLNDKFKFSGQVDHPKNIYIIVKNSRNYKSFWLENNQISFEAENGKFKEAKITGSQLQKDENELNLRLERVQEEQKKIENELNEARSKSQVDSLEKQFEILQVRATAINQAYVREFPNTLVSAYILNIYKSSWGKELTQSLFNNFSDPLKNSEYGEKISNYITWNQEPKISEQFVDFEMEDQHGKTRRLSEFRGKIILLEFWASWCGPCREENPELVKTYNSFKQKDFEIFAVSLDLKKDSWWSAIKKDHLNWTHVSDLKGSSNKAALIYGVNGIPDNFLIGKNGQIIGRDLRGEDLNQKLKEIIE